MDGLCVSLIHTEWTVNDVLFDPYHFIILVDPHTFRAIKGYRTTKMIKGYESIKTSLTVHAGVPNKRGALLIV